MLFHRIMMNDSMEAGTQLPYIREALERKYAVMVLNTNDNRPDIEVCSFTSTYDVTQL